MLKTYLYAKNIPVRENSVMYTQSRATVYVSQSFTLIMLAIEIHQYRTYLYKPYNLYCIGTTKCIDYTNKAYLIDTSYSPHPYNRTIAVFLEKNIPRIWIFLSLRTAFVFEKVVLIFGSSRDGGLYKKIAIEFPEIKFSTTLSLQKVYTKNRYRGYCCTAYRL